MSDLQQIAATEPAYSLGDIADLDDYPIDRPGTSAYDACVAHIRAGLRADGCACLRDLVRPELQAALQQEVAAIAPRAHFSHGRITPYFNEDEPDLPADHPRRRFDEFSNGFVAMDWFPVNGICLTLYRDPDFMRFIADCLEEETLYTFDDPLAGVVSNIMPEGTSLPWHYDTNEYIVSLMTLQPHTGGSFEYCPDLRRPGDENYDAVQAVLDGDRSRVKVLDLRPGDLQIFKGRFSMHRVVPGEGERHTVLFGYARQPGFIGRVFRTRQVHGRVTQAHIDAEKDRRDDGLDD
jgi:hypothetical protein